MAKELKSLNGQVVAITGAARGIGKATARALIAQGAKVAIGDIDGALVATTAQELGAGTVGLPVDVTKRDSFAAFLDEAEAKLGPLDTVINNAGIMPVGSFVEETDATALRLVDINLHGVIYGSKLALERFAPRGHGHIVNIASVAGKGGGPHIATYAATKHAVVGLTESLRQEYPQIGFSLVMPVGVNTELYSGLQQLRGVKTPEPEDVAAAIVQSLQTGRFEVYVPRRMKAVFGIGGIMPRKAFDAVSNLLGAGSAVTHPDHTARAAYEARMIETVAAAETPADALEQEPETVQA